MTLVQLSIRAGATALRLAFASLVAMALSTGLQPAAHAAPLTLAIPDLPVFSTALVAEAEGYFAAEGLDLKIIRCVIGKLCLKLLTDGKAHYAGVADTPIVMASLGGAVGPGFAVIATLATTSRLNQLIARADRGIRVAADLKGKRIGVFKGTTSHYFADTLLLLNGIGTSQVTLVLQDPADAAGPLVRGEVDAAAMHQTHAHKVKVLLGANMVTIPTSKLVTMTFNLVSVPAAAGGRDQDAVKLLRAMTRANQLMAADPKRAKAIVAARLKLEPALLDAIWGDYDFELSLAQPLIMALEAQARWALREGLVPGGKMPDYLNFVRPEALRTLDRRAVTLVK